MMLVKLLSPLLNMRMPSQAQIDRDKYRRDVPVLSISEVGVIRHQRNSRRYELFYWDDVTHIETYKIDLLTYDMICLAFVTRGGWFEIREEDIGFPELMDALNKRYPEFPPQWYYEVMHPAFEENRRTLWSRSKTVK